MADEQVQTEETTVDYEAEATEMGWVPEDKYRGPKDKWVDAKTFYERGENIFPIIRATNKRLKAEALTRDNELASVKSALDASQKAIKALQKSFSESTKAQVEAAKKELREQFKAAREAGDTDAEFEIQDKLDDLRKAEVVAKETTETTEPPKSNNPMDDPVYRAWQQDNPWFSDMSTKETRRKTRQLMGIANELLQDGSKLKGREFMDECVRILEEEESELESTPRRTTSKVEGGGGNGRSNQATGYDSLPKEAKDVCESEAEQMVGNGPGQFKTKKEWQAYYYKQYSEN